MKILITGGAGYLGSVFTRNLLKNHEVIVYDNLMYNQTSLVDLSNNPNFTFHYGDVREWSKLKYLVEQVDIVIPLAALVGFPLCEKDKDLATSINTTQIQNIVDVLSNDQMILYPNTNSGYGTRGKGMVDETNELTPISHYGKTKCEAEDYIINESNGISFRLATVFGVSSRMRTDLLVNDFANKCLRDGYLVVYQKNFMRTFIHVKDIAKVFMFAIEHPEEMSGEVYNVGSNSMNHSKGDVCKLIQEKTDCYVHYADFDGDADKRDYVVSYDKINGLGYDTTISVDEGIDELLRVFPIVQMDNKKYKNG